MTNICAFCFLENWILGLLVRYNLGPILESDASAVILFGWHPFQVRCIVETALGACDVKTPNSYLARGLCMNIVASL